jgi:hypothetical protein
MKEAKLISLSRECDFETEEIITISNKVRRSALNLVLYEENKFDSAAATAAMVVCAFPFKTNYHLPNFWHILFLH